MNGTDYILSGIIILLSSFVQGFSGFGFGLLATPLLTIIIGVKSAITISVTCSLFITFYNFVVLRKFFTITSIRKLIIGSFVGIPLGAYFLRETHSDIVEFLLGGIVLTFVFLSSFQLIKRKEMSDKWGYIFGFTSGVCGGAVSISGPPFLIYSYLRGWAKEEFKGTFAAYILITGLFIQLSHITTGLATQSTFLMFVKLFPFLLAGGFVGHYYFNSIDTILFRKLILFILFVLGSMMIVSNLV